MLTVQNVVQGSSRECKNTCYLHGGNGWVLFTDIPLEKLVYPQDPVDPLAHIAGA